jgi:hypothetical protein
MDKCSKNMEPVGHIFPDALERLVSSETAEMVYSVAQGRPDGDKTIPLYCCGECGLCFGTGKIVSGFAVAPCPRCRSNPTAVFKE